MTIIKRYLTSTFLILALTLPALPQPALATGDGSSVAPGGFDVMGAAADARGRMGVAMMAFLMYAGPEGPEPPPIEFYIRQVIRETLGWLDDNLIEPIRDAIAQLRTQEESEVAAIREAETDDDNPDGYDKDGDIDGGGAAGAPGVRT